MKARPSSQLGIQCASTLFWRALCTRLAWHAGLRSLARTQHPFLAAGTAKGPTPAMTSETTWNGRNWSMRRPCSVCRRLFQYTCRKSSVKRQPDSDTCAVYAGLPANSSIAKTRNSVSIVSSLLTTVSTRGVFSRITWPIR